MRFRGFSIEQLSRFYTLNDRSILILAACFEREAIITLQVLQMKVPFFVSQLAAQSSLSQLQKLTHPLAGAFPTRVVLLIPHFRTFDLNRQAFWVRRFKLLR
jgi:hypothetical protein